EVPAAHDRSKLNSPVASPAIRPAKIQTTVHAWEKESAMQKISFSFLLIGIGCCAQAPEVAVKPPTEATRQVNDRARQQMHLNDERDFAEARRGRIAPLPNGGVVRDSAGNTVMDAGSFGFVKSGAPDSVNPGLWRQLQLESETGLFQVTDRIYQVRGYDISGITFMEGDRG